MPVRANRIPSTASSARRSVGTAARRRTQAERSEETQTRILKAAASLIRKRGYAHFRTAEVAKEAGLSRGAQLHHFPTKDSLVVATLEYVFEQARVLSRRRATAVNRMRESFSLASTLWLPSISFFRPQPINRCASRFSIFREKHDVR